MEDVEEHKSEVLERWLLRVCKIKEGLGGPNSVLGQLCALQEVHSVHVGAKGSRLGGVVLVPLNH